jgi:hypothetical protein
MEIVKYLDIYTQNFSFTHKGQLKIRTLYGVVISLLTYIIFMINAFIIGKDIIYKENPKEIKSTRHDINTPTMRLNKNISKIGFSVSDSSGEEFIDESIFSIVPVIYMQKIMTGNRVIYKEYLLEMEDCDKSNSIYYRRCIKNLDIYLGGDWNENHLTYLMLYVIKCKNETEQVKLSTNVKTKEDLEILENYQKNFSNIKSEYFGDDNYNLDFYNYLKNYKNEKKIICKSPEDIQNKLNQKNFINVVYEKIYSDSMNFLVPLSQDFAMEFIEVDKDMKKYMAFNYENYFSETDEGIIFSNQKKKQNKIGIDKITRDISIKKDAEILAILDFYSNSIINNSTRSYVKLPDIFASLGGFISLTMIFFKLISFPFFKNKLKSMIINGYFDTNEELSINVIKKL